MIHEKYTSNIITIVMVFVLLGVVGSNTSFAGGDRYSPRIIGMGRTYTAHSRGLDAVGLNPANLALDDRNATVTINFVPFGLSAGSDFINYKIYNDFFTGDPNLPLTVDGKKQGKQLSAQDKNDILGLFPGGIAHTQASFETSPIGFSLQAGNFGLAIVPSVRAAVNFDLVEDYLKFAFNTFGIEGNKYSFNNTAVNASIVAEMNVSAAYILPLTLPAVTDISFGIGVKYLAGLASVTTERYNASIENVIIKEDISGQPALNEIQVNGNADFIQRVALLDPDNLQPVGSGMGYDVGISFKLADIVLCGISVTDIGSMTWDKQTKAIIGSGKFSISGNIATVADSVSNVFKGKSVDTTGFKTDLPTALHIGTFVQIDQVIDLPFRWGVAADLHLGFNEAPGNSKTPLIGLGTELDFLAGWLPLRTGILLGGRERFAWSAGLGIHIFNSFDLDFATESVTILTNPESFRNGSFTMGMRLRI